MLGSFMGAADYGAFIIAIILFLLIPGPGNLALSTSTGKGGIAGGLGATLTFHLVGLTSANPRLTGVMNKAAGIYLIAFGIKLAISK